MCCLTKGTGRAGWLGVAVDGTEATGEDCGDEAGWLLLQPMIPIGIPTPMTDTEAARGSSAMAEKSGVLRPGGVLTIMQDNPPYDFLSGAGLLTGFQRLRNSVMA